MLEPSFEFEISCAGSHARQQFAAAQRNAKRVVRSGRIPGGEVGRLRWVVEEDPIERIVGIVRKRFRGRLRDVAAIDDNEIGERVSSPEGFRCEVVGRLDLVSDGLQGPRNFVQKRNVFRNHHDVEGTRLDRHQGLPSECRDWSVWSTHNPSSGPDAGPPNRLAARRRASKC